MTVSTMKPVLPKAALITSCNFKTFTDFFFQRKGWVFFFKYKGEHLAHITLLKSNSFGISMSQAITYILKNQKVNYSNLIATNLLKSYETRAYS